MGKIDSHTVQENRFTRLIPLMGEDGLKRLTQARVMVLQPRSRWIRLL